MTWSGSSDQICPKCSGPLSLRQVQPYPVASQVAFALSFVAFLWAFERIQSNRAWLWIWCTAQVALGVLLIRGRLRARRRVLRCIRCDQPLE